MSKKSINITDREELTWEQFWEIVQESRRVDYEMSIQMIEKFVERRKNERNKTKTTT